MAGLKTRKKQRLVVMIVAVAVLALAAFLIVFAGRQTGSFNLFLQPSEVFQQKVAPGQRFRLGGLVETGTFERKDDGLTYEFRVTDCAADIPVRFTGMLPSLFREGQGVVSEGALNAEGVFVADTVLAKHDENYAAPGTMPKNEEACSHPEALTAGQTGR
ncbi:cytochrome c maturation protein CcmE [Kordiimonas lipolytica]|uniref:Cytochrome c-type biogenesis protein CcmE n=1 Tax=Kordiimonas lipolytica TaxID=1662421 RepID=A0ABV8U6P6_9PROT|nr:cytochrome c maturation protein CcmE [Kordiimonas lipolytica]